MANATENYDGIVRIAFRIVLVQMHACEHEFDAYIRADTTIHFPTTMQKVARNYRTTRPPTDSSASHSFGHHTDCSAMSYVGQPITEISE